MASENDNLDASGQVPASTPPKNEGLVADNEYSDEYIASVVVNFLMSMVTSLDVVNQPRFRAALESVVRHGPRCCKLLENPTLIQKSLWKFEHGMKQYMLMVMQSWKTTGCTLIFYTLKEGDMLVLGFYCPMGIIFVEVPPSKQVNRFFNYYEIGNALKDVVPDSSWQVWKDVVQVIDHCPSYQSECRYQARDMSDTNESLKAFFTVGNKDMVKTKCIRQQVAVFWRSICKESKWVKGLTKKADKIYEYVVSSDLYGKFYKTLKQKKPSLAIIMELESELKAWLSRLSKGERFHLENDTDVAAIIDNNEFWSDGNELIVALAPVLKIPLYMDTLVPSAGDLGVAISKAKRVLNIYSEHQPLKFKQISECSEDWRLNSANVVQDAAVYLHPAYILNQEMQENLELDDVRLWGVFYDLAETRGEDEEEVLDVEIENYSNKSSNPFANVSKAELEATHPILLWIKYGAKFRYLQKCAYKLLNQPSCCLCEQVGKHMSTLEERADNYILRLNGLMIDEFRMMGMYIHRPMGLL